MAPRLPRNLGLIWGLGDPIVRTLLTDNTSVAHLSLSHARSRRVAVEVEMPGTHILWNQSHGGGRADILSNALDVGQVATGVAV